jgi:transposase
MRAFYQRVSARRGKAIAIVAVARKLAVLFWHLLIAEKDYAFARPSLTAHKLRELELRAGAERRMGSRSLQHKSGYHQQHNRDLERETAAQAELAYQRLVTDWKRANPEKSAAVT